MEEFQTIAIFNYSHEIVVIKHLLEQEDINPSVMENLALAQAKFNWLMENIRVD